MGYLVVNPSAGNNYFNTSGSALSATSQPKVKSGAAKGLGADAALLDNSPQQKARTVYGSKLVMGAGRNIGSAFWSLSGTAITSVASASGFCVFTLNSHGLAVGDVLNIVGSTTGNVDGIHNILAKDANTFTTDVPYVASAAAGSYFLLRGTFAGALQSGHYAIIGVTDTLAGSISNTVLRSGGGDFGVRRAIHQVEHVRTRKVSTAIRAGYWNEFSGSWTTNPALSDDISTWETNGVDTEAAAGWGSPGELSYLSGNRTPTQADYTAKVS